ncbi:uncharacterized protein VDAG_05768 [Verticillium dahliae VdLs.17]|uniref:Uncharacterized protein n=1 Tax=Verticillium dahliae (strain VdLs.17 / ATCC MYA-4575 / FGSC 10137) TaxID=498257 RepID=G2X6I6_VERDV|nr:uncharacterized protein VDAG_05768 [Verticillium dahliae VdLs.17]EGY14604.1 hypothetical protein VDAG_05768 [Verticillium dahliae VdLs.17]
MQMEGKLIARWGLPCLSGPAFLPGYLGSYVSTNRTQCIPLDGSLPSTHVGPGVRKWATADQGEAGTASGGAPTAVFQGLEQHLPLYNPPLRSSPCSVTGTSGTHSLGLHLAGSPAMPRLAQGLPPPPQCQADTYSRSLPEHVSLPLLGQPAREPASRRGLGSRLVVGKRSPPGLLPTEVERSVKVLPDIVFWRHEFEPSCCVAVTTPA